MLSIFAASLGFTVSCTSQREPPKAKLQATPTEAPADQDISAESPPPPTLDEETPKMIETSSPTAKPIATGLDDRLESALASEGLDAVTPTPPGAPEISAEERKGLYTRTVERLAHAKPRTRHLHADGRPKYTNRLALSGSPYLLQHAHNPVNWHPWGPEAFAAAKALDRPIFLSVGYSTCHWCHVMEEESFEDVEIARYINANFIPVKVDREQRPDVDDVYMTAVQVMTGRGGWPMTVVMLPDGRPFFGATYIPPRSGARGARQGLIETLTTLSGAYRDRRAELVADAANLSQRIRARTQPAAPTAMPGVGAVASAARRFIGRFDHEYGGVGGAPKFPTPSVYSLLLRHHRRSGDDEALEVVTRTLDAMARGGIYDQLGGGFHRYSTDRKWLVPHFEKMLYDNAQLAVLYLEVYQQTKDPKFALIARQTLDYVAREMTSPEGGFYSATDADSEGEEGLFFVWKPAELAKILTPQEAAIVTAHYGVTPRGNFEGHTIFSVVEELDVVAKAAGVSLKEAQAQLASARQKLYDERLKRIPPGLDDKVITAWNGLMIQAFAKGAWVLREPRYQAHAVAAAEFLQAKLWTNGQLMRTYRGGRAEHPGYLDDHAFLIAGLLELFELTADPQWLSWSVELQGILDAHFADSAGGYFFTGDAHEALLIRQKPDYDGAEPSGNAIAGENLLKLGALTGEHAFRASGQRLLAAFGAALQRRGTGLPKMLCALGFEHDRNLEVIIVTPDGQDVGALGEVLRGRFAPSDVRLIISESEVESLAKHAPPVSNKGALDGKPTAYVCEAGSCERPTNDPEVLKTQLP